MGGRVVVVIWILGSGGVILEVGYLFLLLVEWF